MGSPSRKKTKIVLDADVIIHFEAGESFSTLLDIFPEYEYIVLDVVYGELRESSQRMINGAETSFKKISKVKFAPTGNSRLDYALLKATKGAGESACMTYCRYNHDVLGSSNLKDIREFCNEHDITCLTTLDFLYHAFVRNKMTRQECNGFIEKVKSKGHKLPEHIRDIAQYVCEVNV